VTIAVICAVPAACTVLALCVIESVVPGTVTSKEFDTAGLATEAAVMVTVKSPAGNVVGAV
jgi:hypothetical protein